MNFQEYVDTVKERIKEYLPEEYAGAEVNVHQMRKLNETYTALSVRKEDQMITPSINLDAFFEEYDGSFVQLNEDLQRMAMLAQTEPENMDMDVLTDYEQAKENLFIRVSSVEQNQNLLDQVPHMIKEDLLITYHITAGIESTGMMSTLINNRMMEQFHVTQEQLHQDALESSMRIMPASIRNMNEVVRPMIREDMLSSGMSEEDADIMLDQMMKDNSNEMTVVTNERTLNGAGVLFYPQMMEELSERMGGDFFILPSSVHEMLVLPDNGLYDAQDLKEMVEDVNTTQVEPEDRLTNEAYHFDSKEHIFEKAETFEARQAAKEKAAEREKEPMRPRRKSAEMTM